MSIIQETDFFALKPGDVIRNRYGEYAVVIGHDRHDRTVLHYHQAEFICGGFTYDNELYKMDIFVCSLEEWHKAGTVGEYR